MASKEEVHESISHWHQQETERLRGRELLTLCEARDLVLIATGGRRGDETGLASPESRRYFSILMEHVHDGSLKSPDRAEMSSKPIGSIMVEVASLRTLFAHKGWVWPIDSRTQDLFAASPFPHKPIESLQVEPNAQADDSTDDQAQGDDGLGKSARVSLLLIVAGALGDTLENQATASAMIERRLQNWGIDRPKKRMILNWLNEAKRLLDERKPKE